MTRLPLTIWAFFITAILGVLSFPVLLAAALLLVFDRSFGTSFYLSDIFIDGAPLDHAGGSPILYQHLFWFLGHPEVYIVLLPALPPVLPISVPGNPLPHLPALANKQLHLPQKIYPASWYRSSGPGM